MEVRKGDEVERLAAVNRLRANFDAEYYFAEYPDMAAARASDPAFDAAVHYYEVGWREGRNPSREFVTRYYLEQNPEVALSGENPFVHYLRVGRFKGLRGRPLEVPVRDGGGKEEENAGDTSVLEMLRVTERDKIAQEFDLAFYVSRNPDIAGKILSDGGFDALEHYIQCGWREGRDPSPDFSTSFYLQANPDVAASGQNPFLHWVERGRSEGRRGRPLEPDRRLRLASVESDEREQSDRETVAAEFDEVFYLARYPDVAQSVGFSPNFDCVAHFMASGWREGRDPHPEFSTVFYLEQYPDVAASGMNPFLHFIKCGRAEGRIGRPIERAGAHVVGRRERDAVDDLRDYIAPDFDIAYYYAQSPDLARVAAIRGDFDPVLHYLRVGWSEGRDPSREFSTSYYLQENPDVASSGENPFYHYVMRGRHEGRPGRPAKPTQAVPEAERDEPDKPVEWEGEVLQQVGDGADGGAFAAERMLIESEFDVAFYLAQLGPKSDSQSDEFDPIVDYLSDGWRQTRDPHPEFSTSYYLATNPDVAASGINPFVHYVRSGRLEGRLAKAPGGYRAEHLRSLRSISEEAAAWTAPARPRVMRSSNALYGALLPLIGSDQRLTISISHDDYTRVSGGVQYCIRREERAFVEAGDCYIHVHPAQPLPMLARSGGSVQLNVGCNGKPLGRTDGDSLVEALRRLGARASSVALIVHALHGHQPEFVVSLASALPSAECFFWLHDYMSICAGYTLLRNGITFCGAPAATSSACELCVYGEEREDHLKRIGALFEAVPFKVVSPSASALQLWEDRSRLRARAKLVHPHCHVVRTAPPRRRKPGPLRIGYLGHPVLHKGWPVFQTLVNRFSKDFRFFSFSEQQSNDPRITWTRVSAGDGTGSGESPMSRAVALAELDYAFVWPMWPETFCFVAYEAIAGGARLITNKNSGNVAALVEAEKVGAVLEHEESLFEFLTALAASKPATPAIGADLTYSRMTYDLTAAPSRRRAV